MAIDMIENSDMGVFSPSRVGGMRQFINDRAAGNTRLRNFTAAEDFFNNASGDGWGIFSKGSKQRKASIAKRKEEIKAKYAKLDTDCENIDKSIEILKNDIQTLVNRLPTLKGADEEFAQAELDQTRAELGRVINEEIKQSCTKNLTEAQKKAKAAELKADLERKAEEAYTQTKQDILGTISGGGVTGTEGGTIAGLPKKKVLLYGGIGLAVVIVGALIIKK